MTKLKNMLTTGIAVLFIAGSVGLTACGGLSDEQIAELDALRNEVTVLEKEVNTLKSEKTKLEREMAEKSAKLDQCKKEQDETKKNLGSMGF
jgi:peptidoglycan hydrolase CwlO-like protein